MDNINLSNLALLHKDEMKELYNISASLPTGACIVEVGSFLGGSAAIMATANPTANITCIDLFEDSVDGDQYHCRDQLALFDRILGEKNAPRTLANVERVLAGYPNITCLKRRSPIGITWNTPIDLYFEDGIHDNPWLARNLDFWTPHIKVGGYLLMHDYRPHIHPRDIFYFPDVINECGRFMSNGFKFIDHVASTVILQKQF